MWPDAVRWALLGTLAVVSLVCIDVYRHGGSSLLSLIQPGASGEATSVIVEDHPDVELPPGDGLDGQTFYVMARDPFHLTTTGEHLGRPRYRLQRPLLSWSAWTLHPTGGGNGLILALFAVGAAGIFVGALATGALSVRWGGPPWLALAFALAPGAYWSLRVTVSDALALALALLAVYLATRERNGWAIAVACLAVMAKEPIILVLVGWWVTQRSRRAALLAGIPALVAGAWALYLRAVFPADGSKLSDIGWPGVGYWDAWADQWSSGQELVGMACSLGGLALGLLALARCGPRHPLAGIIALQLAFLMVMAVNPIAMNFGGTRMAMPVFVVSALALATPSAKVPASSALP